MSPNRFLKCDGVPPAQPRQHDWITIISYATYIHTIEISCFIINIIKFLFLRSKAIIEQYLTLALNCVGFCFSCTNTNYNH